MNPGHGTDHRPQTLAILAPLGVETSPQVYALYTMGKL